MKMLAIMQNQWVRDPERVKAMIERTPAVRRRLIEYALFAGCKSGRVLRKVFGDLCDEIIWDEASPKIGGHAASVFKADVDHIAKLILDERPDVVIGFGKIACDALSNLTVDHKFRLLKAPHPASRQPDVMAQLFLIKAQLSIS